MNKTLIKKLFTSSSNSTIQNKKVALILAGAGRMDGSEITEAVSCMIALSKRNIPYVGVSLNQFQTTVNNHISGEEINEKRNLKQESARITRDHIVGLKHITPNEYSGIVFPGGFGVAKNLSNYAVKGSNFEVNPIVENKIKLFHQNKLPIAACCISPLILAKVLGPNCSNVNLDDEDIAINSKMSKIEKKKGITITLGKSNNKDFPYSEAIRVASGLGNNIVEDKDVVIDEINKIVTTYAYMKEASSAYEVFQNIDKMIEQFSKWIKL